MFNLTRLLIEIVLPFALVCWLTYVAFGAIAGASGINELNALDAKAKIERGKLEALITRRIKLEKRADMLNPRSLDPDMVDERIRSVLGYVHENDIVLPTSELDRFIAENRDSATQ